MISVTINNPEIEQKFKQYANIYNKSINDLTYEAINFFLNFLENNKNLKFKKKDPLKNIEQFENKKNKIDEGLSDIRLFTHIKDSAEYIHNLRRIK